ncbi:hypothetical protein BDV93DRAFT_507074 [Ceratobasidium sp. AG-I]|nr:hypothetical protein BDV93DRAFT_507074 [Ceratobasidium sp. AG-I]
MPKLVSTIVALQYMWFNYFLLLWAATDYADSEILSDVGVGDKVRRSINGEKQRETFGPKAGIARVAITIVIHLNDSSIKQSSLQVPLDNVMLAEVGLQQSQHPLYSFYVGAAALNHTFVTATSTVAPVLTPASAPAPGITTTLTTGAALDYGDVWAFAADKLAGCNVTLWDLDNRVPTHYDFVKLASAISKKARAYPCYTLSVDCGSLVTSFLLSVVCSVVAQAIRPVSMLWYLDEASVAQSAIGSAADVWAGK